MADAYKLYKYDIEVSIVSAGQSLKLEPSQINRVLIEKNFDNCLYPVFAIGINLPLDKYVHIVKNKFDTTFIISLYKYIQSDDTGSVFQRSVLVQGKFTPIIKDDTPVTDLTYYKQIKYGSGFTTNDLIVKDLETNYTFILFKKEDLAITSNISNTVFPSINLRDAIAYTLNSCGVSNVLMSNLDNTSSYSEFIDLAVPVAEKIRFYDIFYGMYREGAIIFFDLDRRYIVRKSGICTAWSGNEPKVISFNISSGLTADKMQPGSYTKNGVVFHNINQDNLNISTLTSSTEQVYGNDIQIFDTLNGSVSSSKYSGSKQLKTGGVQMVTKTTENIYIAQQKMARTIENDTCVNITAQNIDISELKPNKEYKLTTDITPIANAVKGKFRLSSARYSFSRNAEGFDVVSFIQLLKTHNG